MKPMLFSLMFFAFATARAADPDVGDTREKVTDELGNPNGHIVAGHNEFLFYDRGTVELANGKVTIVRLLTDDQLAAKQAAAAEQARLAEAQQKKLAADGIAEKERTLADAVFAKKSPADQLAYWLQFAKKYPGVAIGDQLKQAQQSSQAAADAKAAASTQQPALPPPPQY